MNIDESAWPSGLVPAKLVLTAEELNACIEAVIAEPERFKPSCPPNCRCQELDP